MKNIILKNDGSTILGTLVTIGILVTLGGIAVQTFEGPKDSVVNIRGVSRCQELADQISDSIQSESPIQEIQILSGAQLSQITSVANNPHADVLNLSTNPVRINQDRRIKGSVNSLKSLLASGPDARSRDFCSSQYGGKPTTADFAALFDLSGKSLGEMQNVDVTLKVQLMDLNTGVASCDPAITLLPGGRELPARAIANSIAANDPQKQTARGYLTTVHIRYKGSNNEDKGCQSQSIVKYPKIYDQNLNTGSIQISLGSVNQCQTTQRAGSVKVNPPANWAAQGIVPLCRDNSTPGSGQSCPGGVTANNFTASNNWVPCHLATLCGKAPGTFSYNADGSIDMSYSDLPWACSAQMDTQFVDMGLNSLNTPFISSNVVNFPSCDSCSSYGWLGGNFCPSGAYTSYCSPPPPPPPPEPPVVAGGGGGPGADPNEPAPNSPEWIVREAYRQVLGREPEAGGAHGWTALVGAGMSKDQLFGEFRNSMEYRMQQGETFTQQQVDEHHRQYNTYVEAHNITNPSAYCSTMADCGTHWSD